MFLECKSSLALTPDTEIGCDRNRPDSQKNVMDGVWMEGVDSEQFERHIIFSITFTEENVNVDEEVCFY